MVYCLYRQAVKAKEYAGSFLRIYADAADPLGSIVNTGRQLRLKKYAGSFLRMYGDPLIGILQIQAVKAGKYAGSFLRMYRDPLVGILPKQAGS